MVSNNSYLLVLGFSVRLSSFTTKMSESCRREGLFSPSDIFEGYFRCLIGVYRLCVV